MEDKMCYKISVSIFELWRSHYHDFKFL